MEKNPQIVTRFAPSPTGLFHVGSYRTALFSYLYARQNGGKFILRIEDTDKQRSKPEYEANILESLKWMNLEYDKLYRQSDELPTHKKFLEKLIADGFAYVSKEPARDKEGKPTVDAATGETKMVEVIRFKNPGTKVKFTDLIRGEIEMDTTDLKDFVIAKNINEPLFHLAVVVDDFTMGVTHIIRGEDHISNTPRQILIQRAIGAPEPVYAHLPLVLGEDRSKLSKRKGALAVTEYRDRGFLSEAIVNGMALLGWNPGTEQEILSLQDLIEKFDITKIQKGGAIFSETKLKWINKEYLKKQPLNVFEDAIKKALAETDPSLSPNAELISKAAPAFLERIDTMGDIKTLLQAGELVYLFKKPSYEAASLLWKDEKDPAKAREHIQQAITLISSLDESNFTQEKIKEAIWPYAEKVGKGSILWPMRYALSGAQKSPDPFALSALLGKTETIARLNEASAKLS